MNSVYPHFHWRLRALFLKQIPNASGCFNSPVPSPECFPVLAPLTTSMCLLSCPQPTDFRHGLLLHVTLRLSLVSKSYFQIHLEISSTFILPAFRTVPSSSHNTPNLQKPLSALASASRVGYFFLQALPPPDSRHIGLGSPNIPHTSYLRAPSLLYVP